MSVTADGAHTGMIPWMLYVLLLHTIVGTHTHCMLCVHIPWHLASD